MQNRFPFTFGARLLVILTLAVPMSACLAIIGDFPPEPDPTGDGDGDGDTAGDGDGDGDGDTAGDGDGDGDMAGDGDGDGDTAGDGDGDGDGDTAGDGDGDGDIAGDGDGDGDMAGDGDGDGDGDMAGDGDGDGDTAGDGDGDGDTAGDGDGDGDGDVIVPPAGVRCFVGDDDVATCAITNHDTYAPFAYPQCLLPPSLGPNWPGGPVFGCADGAALPAGVQCSFAEGASRCVYEMQPGLFVGEAVPRCFLDRHLMNIGQTVDDAVSMLPAGCSSEVAPMQTHCFDAGGDSLCFYGSLDAEVLFTNLQPDHFDACDMLAGEASATETTTWPDADYWPYSTDASCIAGVDLPKP